jgi:hypothetical protein
VQPAAPATPTATPEAKEADEGNSDGNGYADGLFDGYTADEIASWRRHIADGLRTLDEVKNAYGLNDAEVEALKAPAPAQKPAAKATSRASIEAELAELRKLRQSDPRRYWSSETQARELELLQARDGKVETAEAEGETKDEAEPASATTETGEIAALEEELIKVVEAQRAAKGTELDRLEARELEIHGAIEMAEARMYLGDAAEPVLELWRQSGTVPVRFEALVRTVGAAKAKLGSEADAFAASIDALPLAARVALMDHCSVADGNPVKQAEAAVRALSGNDKTAAQAWLSRWRGAFA